MDAIHRLKLLENNTIVYLKIRIEFLNEWQWKEMVNWQLRSADHSRWMKFRIKHFVNAFEDHGDIFVRKKARKKWFFKKLILHELGHAVLNFDDCIRPFSVMNYFYFLRL